MLSTGDNVVGLRGRHGTRRASRDAGFANTRCTRVPGARQGEPIPTDVELEVGQKDDPMSKPQAILGMNGEAKRRRQSPSSLRGEAT